MTPGFKDIIGAAEADAGALIEAANIVEDLMGRRPVVAANQPMAVTAAV